MIPVPQLPLLLCAVGKGNKGENKKATASRHSASSGCLSSQGIFRGISAEPRPPPHHGSEERGSGTGLDICTGVERETKHKVGHK